MAEEHNAAAPVEEQETTAPQGTTEASSEAPVAATAGAESSEPALSNGDTTATTSDDATAAGAVATTEVNAPDGDGKAEVEDLPSAVAADDGTPSSGKNQKRKSSAGVPEHKTKKLNKKKSTAQLNLDVQPGEYYWARLKGYPPWPSIVCDEEMLPETLLATRPISTKRPDGTYREDFLEGGKNARDRTYPMMFLGTNEFAWMVNTTLTKLQADDCVVNEKDKKMTKALQLAYTTAAEQHDLDYYKDMLKQFQEAMKDEAEEKRLKEVERAEAEAKKAEKAEKSAADKDGKDKKARRKSKAAAGDDAMDVDEVDGEAKPSKKRKKDAESEGEGAKPKKTPKALKLNAPKTPGSTAKNSAKPKKRVTKPDEEASDEKTEAPLSEAEKLQRREKAILYLRHRLQKAFLSRDTPPKEDEMTTMAGYFNDLENYADLEAQIIRTTKIHKVLKAIIKLSSIPKEEEFQFKKRSSGLLDAWNNALANDGDAPGDAPATNGTTKAEENGPATDLAAKAEEEVEKEATKESSAAPVEATELGNDAVDEADATMADAKDDEAAAVADESVEAPAATDSETAAA